MHTLGRPWRVRLLLLALVAVGGAAACTAPNDAYRPRAAAVDAPPIPVDTGVSADSGGSGAAPDAAGPPGADADTAAPPGDAPVVGTDTGPPGTDAAPPATDAAPTAGLMAALSFDQPPAGGRTLVDAFGNTATLNGPIAWSDDRPPGVGSGQSLAFTAGTSYVEITMVPSRRLASTGSKTVSFWFRSTDPGTALRTLIALCNSGRQADVGLQLGIGETKIEAWAYGRSFRAMNVVTPTPRAWHHVAYTFADGTHLLYVDGVQVDRSTTWTAKTGILDVVKLGTWDQAAETTGFYQGLMRELRLYDRALAPAEIRSLAGLP